MLLIIIYLNISLFILVSSYYLFLHQNKLLYFDFEFVTVFKTLTLIFLIYKFPF